MALGYRNHTDLADSLQFTVRTLADIEHGVRKASAGTYAMLENKLAWAPGSIDTILAGGEPNETVVKQRRTTHNPLAHTATEAPSRASSEELLLELLCLAGRQPHPHRQLQRALRSDSGINGGFRRGERGTYPIAGVL